MLVHEHLDTLLENRNPNTILYARILDALALPQEQQVTIAYAGLAHREVFIAAHETQRAECEMCFDISTNGYGEAAQFAMRDSITKRALIAEER